MAATGRTWVPSPNLDRFCRTVSINPASITNATFSFQSFTVTGLKPGPVFVDYASTPENAAVFLLKALCYSNDTLKLIFFNNDAAPVNLAAANFIVWQP